MSDGNIQIHIYAQHGRISGDAALSPLLPGRAARELREDESPFAGLSAFQESDAARFFGRASDIARLMGRLRNQPLVVVAGPSGAGKSSFVRAGVIPALKRSGERWEAFILRPGRRPLADVLTQVADTLAESAPGSVPMTSAPAGKRVRAGDTHRTAGDAKKPARPRGARAKGRQRSEMISAKPPKKTTDSAASESRSSRFAASFLPAS